MPRRRSALLSLVALLALLTPVGADAAPSTTFACGLTGSGYSGVGPTDRALYQASTGRLTATVLFVDFSDEPGTEAVSAVTARFKAGADAWFKEVSYGKASLAWSTGTRWLRMPKAVARYGMVRGRVTFDSHRAFFADAVAAADATTDFRATRLLFVVTPSGSTIDFSAAFVAPVGRGIRADGVELRHAANFGDDVYAGGQAPYVVTHETGHLFGLPDLFDYAGRTNAALHGAVGQWDPMGYAANGTHLLAWHTWKLGWIADSQVRCHRSGTATVALTAASTKGGTKAVVVPTGTSKAFVVEARRATGRDAALCDAGVLVYAVDLARDSGKVPVQVRSAQPTADAATVDRCLPLSNAPFDLGSGEVARFTDAASRTTIEVTAETATTSTVRVSKG